LQPLLERVLPRRDGIDRCRTAPLQPPYAYPGSYGEYRRNQQYNGQEKKD